jgi:signal transduction histidine kinase
MGSKPKVPDDHITNERARLFHLLVHDIRGPLSIVSVGAKNLRHKADRYGPLTVNQKRLLDRILRNVGKAQSFIHEMTEILRSEEGAFQVGEFSVEASVKESLLDALEMTAPTIFEELYHAESGEEFQALIKKHGIAVEIGGKYRGSPFCHDAKKIQQILRNLMTNAMKYRRTQMGVRISGEVDLAIVVEDDGPGIPPEAYGAVFAPFVQVTAHTDSCVPGLGFGLTGVRILVKAMGGDIRWESREGAGTRFVVRVPPVHPAENHSE